MEEFSFKASFDGGTSLKDYSSAGFFGEAFNNAQLKGGYGHTFVFNGNFYNTKSADGGNYGKNYDLDRFALENYCRYLYHVKSAELYAKYGDSAYKKFLM